METVKNSAKEIAKAGAFPVTFSAGDGMSPTVSFKKDPNLDAFAKTWTSAREDLLSLIVTMATWNQEESDLHSRGLPWCPCKCRDDSLLDTDHFHLQMLETLVNRRMFFYRMKIHGISADVVRIQNCPTICHLSFKFLKTWGSSFTS